MPLSRRTLITGLMVSALPAPAIAQRSFRVVTTTAMLADAARLVAGDSITVDALMGEGVDPHLYRPTRADILRLTQADLIIGHGLGLEAQFRETFAQLGRQRPVVLAADSIPADLRLKDEDVPEKPDPHVWMDVSLWKRVVATVHDALERTRPSGVSPASLDLRRALASLDDLETYVRRTLASIPPDRRLLVTAHDAFGYLARAYSLEVKGIQGLSTESEAGLRAIEQTVDILVSRRIPAIFVESSVTDRNIRAVIEGAGRRGHAVSVGGELFSDAMGKPGTYEGTYAGMMDHNATTIARALGGTAPERGMSGRLERRR